MKPRTVAFIAVSSLLYVLLACAAHGADRPRFKVRIGTSAPWLPSQSTSGFAFSVNRGVSFSEVVDQIARETNAGYSYAGGDPSLYLMAFNPVATGDVFPFYAEGNASASKRGIPLDGSASVEIAKDWWVEAHLAKSETRGLSLGGSRSYAYIRKVGLIDDITFRPALLAEARHMQDDESRTLGHHASTFGLECTREVGTIRHRAALFLGGGAEHWTLTRERTARVQVSEYNRFASQGGTTYLLAAPLPDDRTTLSTEVGAPTDQISVIRPYVTGVAEIAIARGLALSAQARVYARGAHAKLPPEKTKLFGEISPAADLPESVITFSLSYTF